MDLQLIYNPVFMPTQLSPVGAA